MYLVYLNDPNMQEIHYSLIGKHVIVHLRFEFDGKFRNK